MIIDSEALQDDAEGFRRMIAAYQFYIGGVSALDFPEKTEVLKELNEGLSNTQNDLRDTENLLAVIKTYEANGIALHKKEVAPQPVIDKIKFYFNEAGLIPADFEPPAVLADGGTVVVT